jgi:hypothetical protein
MQTTEGRKPEKQAVSRKKGQSSISPLIQFIFRRPVKNYLWVLLFILWVGAFVLGYIGLSKAALTQAEELKPLDLIYRNLQLVVFESGAVPNPVPWELEIARFALPALAAYTAIQALAILFREQTQVLRLRFSRDHIVICGLSRKGLLLAKNLLAENRKVVMIELDEGNDLIEQLRVRGAIIVTGDATDPKLLRRVSVQNAKCLIAVCEDDGTNAEIAVQAQNLILDFDRDPLTCFIHIVDPRLCDLLRENEIGGNTFPGLRLELFNVYERGAQLVLEEYPPFELDEKELNRSPHILLVGMGKMGESVAMRLAYAWRSSYQNSKVPLRVTVIDLQAEEKVACLAARYPHLAVCCNFSPISMDVTSSRFYDAHDLFASDGRGVDIIYICFDHDSLGLNVGLTLSRLMMEQEIPIVVRMIEARGLALLLRKRKGDGGTFSNLHVFNLLDKTCTTELLLGGMHEMLARSVHEDYVRQQRGLGRSEEENKNLVPWDQLLENVKDSNRRYADHISIKLQAVDCYLAPLQDWDALEFQFTAPEVETMAEMEHERWVQERRREGWTYGEERDDHRKVHPFLVLWDNLPEGEKEKNREFIRDLPRILARTGFQIQRTQ